MYEVSIRYFHRKCKIHSKIHENVESHFFNYVFLRIFHIQYVTLLSHNKNCLLLSFVLWNLWYSEKSAIHEMTGSSL